MKNLKFDVFKEKTGTLIPFYNNDHYKNFKLKRFFLSMEKKDSIELIMLIKNVTKSLFQ